MRVRDWMQNRLVNVTSDIGSVDTITDVLEAFVEILALREGEPLTPRAGA